MNYRRAYIDNSMVFLTIVTSKRRGILVDNIELLRESYRRVRSEIEFETSAMVVLPDHIHMIIQPREKSSYPEIIKRMKTYFTRGIDTSKMHDYEETESKRKKHEKDIWQRRYWEHTITNEIEKNDCIDYIHFNPVKHGYVKLARDWQYSTFLRYVNQGFYDENWCDFSQDRDLYE